jgi:hypothetical protein
LAEEGEKERERERKREKEREREKNRERERNIFIYTYFFMIRYRRGLALPSNWIPIVIPTESSAWIFWTDPVQSEYA